MKKQNLFFTSLALCVLISYGISAQNYCEPVVDVQYSFGAGITQVKVGSTLDRTSVSTEGYINTGSSVSLSQGQTYSFSVACFKDNLPCQSYNIAVWIDYNGDKDFTDIDEDAVYLSGQKCFNGPSAADFLVPSNATLGTTRMRVALKMVESCGHNTPTPCDIPKDWAWHGEIEDYTVNLTGGTGIEDLLVPVLPSVSLIPSTVQTTALFRIRFPETVDRNVTIDIFDVFGKKINAISLIAYGAKETEIPFSREGISSGIYLYRVTFSGSRLPAVSGKFIVM